MVYMDRFGQFVCIINQPLCVFSATQEN